MADDQLKSESRRDLADIVFDIGTTAAAFGAGAVSLYRLGGARRIAETLNKARDFAREATDELLSYSYNDINSESLLGIQRNLKSSWRRISDEHRRQPFQLSISQNNFLTAAAEYSATMKRLPQYVEDMYNADLYAEVMKRAGNINRQHARAYSDFIRNVIASGKNAERYVLDKHKEEFNPAGNIDLNKLADDSIELISRQRDEKPYEDFRDEMLLRLRKGLKDKFLNVKNLADKYGASFLEKSRTSKLFGDDAVTVGDLLENRAKVKDQNYRGITPDGDTFEISLLKNVEELAEQIRDEQGEEAYKNFLSLHADSWLRKDKYGNMISMRGAKGFFDSLLNAAAGTMPGKVLKLRDVEQSLHAPNFHLTTNATNDPILASIMGNDKSSMVSGHFLRILDKTYQITDQGFEHIKELDDTRLTSSRFGSFGRQIRKMAGEESARIVTPGSLQDRFDIRTTPGKTIFESGMLRNKDLRKAFKADTDIFMQMSQASPDMLQQILSGDDEAIRQGFNFLSDFTKFLNKNVFQLSNEAVHKLRQVTDEGNPRYILDTLLLSDEDMIDTLLKKYGSSLRTVQNDSIINMDLSALLRRYMKDPQEAMKSIALKGDSSNAWYQGNTPQTFFELVRTELGKEYFLQYAKEKGGTTDSLKVISDFIESANIQKERKNTKRLAYLSLFEKSTGVYQQNKAYTESDKRRAVQTALGAFNSPSERKEVIDFRKTIRDLVKEKYDNVDIKTDRSEIIQGPQYGKYIHIKKTYGAKYLIEQINLAIKGEANLRDIARPITSLFVAGRGNMKDVTTATMIPYTAISRLTEEMERIGLGFSSKYTDNFLKYSGAFLTKRILPVALGYNYYDWFDDTVQAITGTGTSATFVNGIANVDLGLRKISDTFMLTGVLSDFKDINPMAQYMFGKGDVQSYEERADYYRNGYDPVRSGRYWIFASSNEFRGGKIQYFEPNLVRRLNSDYEDKALYDGYFDKWSHSLLPTPTNPISPLIGILDPYWIENRFKDERPYLLSGKLFSENTPWGIILNPTIGEIIKPQKRMHQDRMYGGIDAKALLYQMNMEQFREAVNTDYANTVVLAGGKTTALTYDPFITEISVKTGWNPVQGYDTSRYENEAFGLGVGSDYSGGLSLDISQYTSGIETFGMSSGGGYGGGGMVPNSPSVIGFAGDMTGNAQMNQLLGGYGGKVDAAAQQAINSAVGQIQGNAYESLKGQILEGAGKGRVAGFVLAEALLNSNPRALDVIRETNLKIKQRAAVRDSIRTQSGTIADTLYNTNSDIAELLDAPTGTDIISEAAISARLITGIYGYGAERFFGIGDENVPHIADAGNITGFNRWFWDQGYGGLGGGASEIGRRFIPAFRRRSEINPLLNEMPEWLPERFLSGDPYASIPKGEMRLPGRGYEAIHVLHPDAFGAYGVFDRFKILADVAPGSAEFKTYRKLAKQYVKDPALIKEMEEIEERVALQQQRHDFYNYRFAGKTPEYREEVVTNVLKDGTFQIYGSDEIYRIGGVKIASRNDTGITSEQALGQFIHPGQTVVLAMDQDIEARRNSDNTIGAAVYVNGENIATSIIDAGLGTKKKDTINYADSIALHGSFMRGLGTAFETIGHIDLPLISSRWMRIRSPYETYLAEEVYGTPYQTWAELTASFLFPAYERAISDTNYTITGLGAMAVQSYFDTKSLTKWQSRAVNAGVSLFNRGAFIGGAISHIIDPDNGRLFRAGQRIGSAAMLLGNMWVSPQNDSLVDSMLTYGFAGYQIADIFRDKTKETTSGVIESIIDGFNNRKLPKKLTETYKAAAFGAALGAVLFAQDVSLLNNNPKKWIPDRIKDKRDMDEYFDRLTYIKFMGLYHKAAEKALEEEGVPVEDIFSKYEESQERIKEIKEELADLAESSFRNIYSRDSELMLRNQLDELQNQQIRLRGGEYTRSAALYKQAAENTMYHITSTRNTDQWYDIIKALPKNERDYFHAFKDVTDDDEREKILEVASPLLERALRQVWHLEQEDIESNEEYFQGRNLPNFLWSGWNPKIDLADVKAKTIKNEGMLFSDFGIYESQLREQDVVNAPNLSPFESQDPITLKANLEATMQGYGLTGVEVSVEPKASSGIDAVVNLAIVTHYQAKQVVDGVFKYM